MTHWIHDYETLNNCFVAVFEKHNSEENKIFVIHDLKNNFKELLNFLDNNIKNNEWHISYNGLAFDSQITHYLLKNRNKLLNLSGNTLANDIYKYAQKCINDKFQDYPQSKMIIKQIDLFKMNHWDNAAKSSSLKWIQYSMDWNNILEMPIHHTTFIQTKDEINTIIEYCLNDVKSTKEIFNKSKPLINLRKELSKKYNINLYSASEPRISKELFAYYMSEKLNIPINTLKSLRTHRNIIKLSDIIFTYIKFETKEFNELLNAFKKVELDPEKIKGGFKYSLNYKNIKTDFGLGGAHGAADPGVYKSNDDFIIISSDVVSFYPNLVIRNKLSPGHFPVKEFCDQYEWFFEERKKISKKDPMNYVYKIILNSTFGLSNDQDSFFYDPQLCMQITINGQLSLMMLYEMIMTNIPEAKAIMQNTDGLETLIPKKYKEQYLNICSEWEKITNLSLEHDTYKKIILADVNNYIALHDYKETDYNSYLELKEKSNHFLFKEENNKYYYAATKLKGRFDFYDLALHKNKSKLVIPKAIYYYFIHNILPTTYLKSNKNILDYCIGSKSKGDWKQVAKRLINYDIEETELQKINRYFICTQKNKKAIKIYKINKIDKREIQLEAGKWKQCLFNKINFSNWEDYHIDITYYLQAIESEINNITDLRPKQLTLF